MKNSITDCYNELKKIIDGISVKDRSGEKLPFDSGVTKMVKMVMACAKSNRKLIFIGNGASASIASHQATDYWKNGGIRAIAFNDAALLTCISNDYGYSSVFEKPIGMFADKGDVLVAISSSGKSQNILNAAETATEKGCKVITLSGFSEDNPLLKLGDLNFYVPASAYSHVEIVHHSICHYALDILMGKRGGKAA
jgi:D-sedoheptulose 7-phosphate isomerase